MKPLLLLSALSLILTSCASAATDKAASAPAAAAPAPKSATIPELSDTPIKDLERMMAGGDLKAQVELAARYGLGNGVEKNIDKAVELLKDAADRNSPEGEYFLGVAYYNGAGVPKDEGAASLLFEKSANQGYAMAQYWMGFMIAYGRGGIGASWPAAMPYLWKAAVQNNVPAALLLAYAYTDANTIDRNPKAAAYWYRRANSIAENGRAQYNLRLLIDHGDVEWQPGDLGEAPKPGDKTPAAQQ